MIATATQIARADLAPIRLTKDLAARLVDKLSGREQKRVPCPVRCYGNRWTVEFRPSR